MSQKHKLWLFLRPKPNYALLLILGMISQLSAVVGSRRNIRHNTLARISMKSVGYGLAVAGAVLALISFVGTVFVPVATVPLLDWEIAALFGGILLVVAVVVHAAD